LSYIIDIKDLSFTYPDGKQALHNINLQVECGQKISLVGANGAGKSTLLMHLNGIFTGEGQIFIDGLLVHKKTLNQIRSQVGVIFQNPDDQLFSPTVYEDVAFGPIYQGLCKQEVQQKVEMALSDVGMSDYASRNPYHLSSGEKKRIAIATVLSMQPEILVFDEPTAGLDPRARRELIELLAGLPQTMLIATHDLSMVESLTPRVIILDHGRVVADGVSSEILHNEEILKQHGLF
jgi:cobalt/nickel transport system ATP-binding protein